MLACLSVVLVGLSGSSQSAVAQGTASKDASAPDAPAHDAPAHDAPAQDAPKTNRPIRAHRRSRPTLDDQVKAFAAKLELNEQQQLAIKTILEQRQTAMLRLRQNSSISGEERIQRFRFLQDQTVQRIRSVLSDEQKKKYDPLAVRRVPEAPDRLSVDDWLKDITPK